MVWLDGDRGGEAFFHRLGTFYRVSLRLLGFLLIVRIQLSSVFVVDYDWDM